MIKFTDNIGKELEASIERLSPDKVFLLTDTNTRQLCATHIEQALANYYVHPICIEAGDEHKTLEATCRVWDVLMSSYASRHSLVINLGGGMVTDLGGFAASTFKRGTAFINIPTTLLAMVDASAGGKTGINYHSLKNELGVFREANDVLIDTVFLKTLDRENLLSGFAEMLKHSLLSTEEMWVKHLNASPFAIQDYSLIQQSVAVKENVVNQDPQEYGLRKALNLGHTVGHAIESLLLSRNTHVLHGYAVAWGLIAELYMSCVLCGFPRHKFNQTVSFIKEHYHMPPIKCDDTQILISLMRCDKKNKGDNINFTLLADIGDIRLDQIATPDLMKEAIEFIND